MEWLSGYKFVEDVDENGNKRETRTIGNKKYVTTFFENSNCMKYNEEYKNGKREGKWIRWHKNGNKFYKEEYKNGKKCGIWETWFEDGNLQSQKDYGSCGKKIESISPRKKSKKSKKAISQKKCAAQGKLQNKITGGCRRKCKIGKEKIGSDGKCTKR